MDQLKMFPAARARRANPQVSHEAATRKTLSGTIGNDIHQCLLVYRLYKQYTAKEAGQILSDSTGNEEWTKGKCWKRISDALRMELLEVVIEAGKELRRDGSRVLRLTELGRQLTN